MSRFCHFCGQELRKPEARFCPACGRPLGIQDLPRTGLQGRPHLLIRAPGLPLQELPLDQPTFTIGRKEDNDVVLPLEYVSGHHGRLEQQEGAWRYVDLGSTNGTFVNGQLVQSTLLQDGDILRIGDLQGNSVGITFRASGAEGPPARASGIIHMGTTTLAMRASFSIGRDPQADIPLTAPVVSWHHARLDHTPRGHTIVDLGSTNGTFVNGQRLAQAHLLQQGDVVQIGPFQLVYEATVFQQYGATGGVRLDGVRLVREVGRRGTCKRILENVDISVYPREFVALVGTSGAGKTTLMMALNGFARAQQGQVLVNGDDLYSRFDLYRALIGYVPQEDIIHKELAVASALRYAARLRLPSDTSGEEIEQRIDAVLELVGMTGQKHQVVSSLSGGQRKRVSIAVELLAEPSLFFLDEPTSGLDPGLEKKMMHTLRRLADGGRTVVLVTHATANIVQCDHVCFLSHGRVVYFGPPEEALPFFEVTSGDFADIYAHLDDPDPEAARQKAAACEEDYKRSSYHRQYVEDRQRELPQAPPATSQVESYRRPRASVARQFLVLTRRYMDLVLRDPLLLTVLMLVMPLVGALLLQIAEAHWLVGNTAAEIEQELAAGLAGARSATYSVVTDSQTLLFIMALAAVLLGLFAAVYEIVKEWSIYQRERMVTLRILPYIASKVVVLGLFASLQCLLLMLVIRLKVDYPAAGVFLPAAVEMYVTLLLGTLAAILLGLFVSAVVRSSNMVIYVVFLVLFFQMIFAGVLFDLPGVTDSLSNLTLTRWTMEGLGSSADVEALNRLTRTRFQPDPISEEVTVEVERPAEDWEPVTVVTTTEEIAVFLPPGITQTVPISAPQVTVHEMVTVTETVTETFTVEPGPTDIFSEQVFRIQYTRSAGHLVKDWSILAGFGLALGLATAVVLKRKDVG